MYLSGQYLSLIQVEIQLFYITYDVTLSCIVYIDHIRPFSYLPTCETDRRD